MNQAMRFSFNKGESNESKKIHEHEEFIKMLNQIEINGSHGTKLDTIIRHAKHLKREDSRVKVLIFSQWQQVLDILTRGLESNGIKTMKLESYGSQKGQASVIFKESPEITAFMLHAKSQSSGLTLTAATHVFIVEPVMSGLDKQGFLFYLFIFIL